MKKGPNWGLWCPTNMTKISGKWRKIFDKNYVHHNYSMEFTEPETESGFVYPIHHWNSIVLCKRHWYHHIPTTQWTKKLKKKLIFQGISKNTWFLWSLRGQHFFNWAFFGFWPTVRTIGISYVIQIHQLCWYLFIIYTYRIQSSFLCLSRHSEG